MGVLLITNGSGDGRSSSWVLFSKFIRFFKKYQHADVHVIRLSPKIETRESFPLEKILITLFFSSLMVSLISKIFPKYLFFVSQYYSKKYTDFIINYIEKNEINRIWIYFDVLPILILNRILSKKNIKYHLSIFDNPFSVNYNKKLKSELYPIFKRTFKNADSIDVTTNELLQQISGYKLNEFNKPCKLSLAGQFKKPIRMPVISKDVKKICLAGSIFGIDALDNFLSSCSNRMQEMEIQFDIYSTFSRYHVSYIRNKFPHVSKNINFYGFIKESDIVEKLQTYDLLYLPLYFGLEKLSQSISSFPSKLHNYLSSGIPIIFHIPPKCALHNYAIENNIGILITSLNHNEILSAFNYSLKYENRILRSKELVEHNIKVSRNQHLDDLYKLIFNIS